jgi:hypothetical protein
MKPLNNPKKGEKPIYRRAGFGKDLFVPPFSAEELNELFAP